MSEEQVEIQDDLFETTEEAPPQSPPFTDLLYAIVSDGIDREGLKQVYKELVMVTKEVEVLIEIDIANNYEASRAKVTDDALPEDPNESVFEDLLDELESDITPSASYDVDYVEDFSDEKEIVESLKEKIRRWLK